MMKKKTTTLLAFVFSITLLFTGCNTSNMEQAAELINNANEQAASNAAEPTATPEPTPAVTQLTLGQKAKLGDWAFTAKKVSIKKQIKTSDYLGYKPDKGNRFICVTLSVKNNGSEAAAFLPYIGYENEMNSAAIYYQDNYEYKPSSLSSLTSYTKDLIDEEIKPLNKKNGVLVFEVPKKVANHLEQTTLKIGTADESVVYPLK